MQIAFPEFYTDIIIRARDYSWGHPGAISTKHK